jgi:hypothetical protein
VGLHHLFVFLWLEHLSQPQPPETNSYNSLDKHTTFMQINLHIIVFVDTQD